MGRIKWNDPKKGEIAQFIADTLIESLDSKSFDSNKVPSLNLRFFCMDYILTYELVKKGIMAAGNMLPLNEEFIYIIENSCWLPNKISTQLLLFKDNKGKYVAHSNSDNDSKSFYDTAVYILSVLSSEYKYHLLIQNKIKEIFESSFTIREKDILYFCIREYINELIYIGYSKDFLYKTTLNYLFKDIESSDDIKTIFNFFNLFDFKEKEYNVVIGVSTEFYKEFKGSVPGLKKANAYEENKLKSDYVISNNILSMDPFTAVSDLKDKIIGIIDVHNAYLHNKNLKILSNGLVKENDKSKFTFIKDNSKICERSSINKKIEKKELVDIASCEVLSSRLLNALSLHNIAFFSEDEKTKLLTLWTILEVLIDTKQANMANSNYISNVLSSILCVNYYSNILNNLYNDIAKSEDAKNYILSISEGNNPVEKLALLLNRRKTNDLINHLKEYPLTIYKIEHYSNIFSSKKNILKDISRHSNRVRWQIMRIYRNRCTIVHKGENFPYLSNILENLNYYIDEMFDYIFLKISEGIYLLNAIFSCARIKDSSNYLILKNKNEPFDEKDFLNIIFNVKEEVDVSNR